jgi:hypothetical protein
VKFPVDREANLTVNLAPVKMRKKKRRNSAARAAQVAEARLLL